MRTCYYSVLANPVMLSEHPNNRRPLVPLPQSLPPSLQVFLWGGLFCTLVALGLQLRPR